MQLSDKIQAITKNYEQNPNLESLLPESEWKGNPLDKKGNFLNAEDEFETGFGEVYKLLTGDKPQAKIKKADKWKQPVIQNDAFLQDDKDVIVWLGHASFFIRLNGVSILIDPVFFSLPNLPRMTKMPLNPEQFKDLDYILVSHNHRDHCDKKTLKLLAKNNPNTTYLTSLRLDKYIRRWTKSENIQTAGWYQTYKTENINIHFLPTRHWCRRYLWDLNTELWGAFLIQFGNKTIYFGGDSGYGNHFEEVGKLFDVDYALIGSGAYAPEWFMAPSHINPTDAFKAAKIMNAKTMIPMHFGTFDLSFEPPSEPVRILRSILETEPIIEHLRVGASFWV
jgi:L-ascorbate metabolism protein UlaG (beta-lactamase superfamily)